MQSLITAFAVAASFVAYAQAPTLQRGDLVRVVPGPPGVDVKTTFLKDFVARVAQAPERVPRVVPLGHYFVMGEQRSTSDITEYWGQHAAGSLQLVR